MKAWPYLSISCRLGGQLAYDCSAIRKGKSLHSRYALDICSEHSSAQAKLMRMLKYRQEVAILDIPKSFPTSCITRCQLQLMHRFLLITLWRVP